MCGIAVSHTHVRHCVSHKQIDFESMSQTRFTFIAVIRSAEIGTNYTKSDSWANSIRSIHCEAVRACAHFRMIAAVDLAMRQKREHCVSRLRTLSTLILVSTCPKYDVMHDSLRCTLCEVNLSARMLRPCSLFNCSTTCEHRTN